MRDGAPEGIRTPGLCLRRAALYPAELRVRNMCALAKAAALRQLKSLGSCFDNLNRLKFAQAAACAAIEVAASSVEYRDYIG